MHFLQQNQAIMKLKAILNGKLTDEELGKLVQRYDVVGDIAIIIVPHDLEHREAMIGNAILNEHPTIKVVAKRVGNYGGEHRTIQLKIIAGENRKETVHKEFGITLKLNPERVYFSVRSATERRRIADRVSAGEHVLVMFSGIGPYPLYIRKFSEADKIIGIEKNPVAHCYAMENLSLNKITGTIRLYNGDVQEIIPQLGIRFHRIVMPLPTSGPEYLSLALPYLKPGGHLHHYVMCQPETLDKAIFDLSSACEAASKKLTTYHATPCGHTGPYTYRYCINASID